MMREHLRQDPPDLPHLVGVERLFRERRGVAGGGEKLVACSQRQVQRLRDSLDHLSARCGSSGFDEAEVPLRNVGVERQTQLAPIAHGTPFPKQSSERSVPPARDDR